MSIRRVAYKSEDHLMRRDFYGFQVRSIDRSRHEDLYLRLCHGFSTLARGVWRDIDVLGEPAIPVMATSAIAIARINPRAHNLIAADLEQLEELA